VPRLPKPSPLRQNRERRDVGLVSLDGGLATMPDPTPGWLAVTKADWTALWSSALVTALLPVTDEATVRRLFGLRDERERMMRGIRRARIVLGSRGQPRANPLYAQVAAFDAEIRQLEDRVGLSPRARLQLGISLGVAVRSLADIAEAIDGDSDAAAADLLLAYAEPVAGESGPEGGRVDGAQPRPRARRRAG
jgi:P27 family predicted phage terminase small subunit